MRDVLREPRFGSSLGFEVLRRRISRGRAARFVVAGNPRYLPFIRPAHLGDDRLDIRHDAAESIADRARLGDAGDAALGEEGEPEFEIAEILRSEARLVDDEVGDARDAGGEGELVDLVHPAL